MAIALPDTTVQCWEIRTVINHLAVMDCYILAEKLFAQLVMHGAKCCCLCTDLFPLDLSQIGTNCCLEQFVEHH